MNVYFHVNIFLKCEIVVLQIAAALFQNLSKILFYLVIVT